MHFFASSKSGGDRSAILTVRAAVEKREVVKLGQSNQPGWLGGEVGRGGQGMGPEGTGDGAQYNRTWIALTCASAPRAGPGFGQEGNPVGEGNLNVFS